MAKRKATSKPKRRRRIHRDEFKREAAKLLGEQQQSVAEVARNWGIHENLLRTWKQRFEAEQEDQGLTEDERMETARLRAENRRLRMERDILKVATAFFAKSDECLGRRRCESWALEPRWQRTTAGQTGRRQ